MLPIQPGQKRPEDPVFQHPPQWIHEAVSAVFTPRDSKRRALLKLLDRIPPRSTPKKQG